MDAPFPEQMMSCIEQFFRDYGLRERGKDLYDEVFESELFFPLQRKAELAQMIRLARSIQPTTVMEIGADKGGGLFHWCKSLTSVTHVIANEIRGTPYKHLFEKNFAKIYFHWVEGSSYDSTTVNSVTSFLGFHGKTIDVLFIDGDKGMTYFDFECYLPLMSRNGIIFIHDILDCKGIQRNIGKLRHKHPQFSYHEIIDVSDYHRERDREKEGYPIRNPYEGWLRHWQGRSCGVGVFKLGG